MIKRIVKLSFQPKLVDSFVVLFQKNQQKIGTYPGCHHLELWRDKNAPNLFFTYSLWESEAALDSYRHSEFFREIWSQLKPMFNAKPLAFSLDEVVNVLVE